jgi:hypothetical protein
MKNFNSLGCIVIDNPHYNCRGECYFCSTECSRWECGLPNEYMFGPPGIKILLDEL